MLSLKAAACSNVGRVRHVNQDAAFTAPWAVGVADGVGGGPAGELASAAFIHRLTSGAQLCEGMDALLRRIRIANWDLAAHTRRDPALRGMATTYTGLWLSEADGLLLAHAGDSRAYLVRDGVMRRQTRDDSLVQALVDRGILTAEEAGVHPNRNVITSSLRGDDRDMVVVTPVSARMGDRWFLCSDGITDYVPDALIAQLLHDTSEAAQAAEALVELALEAGTRDNVTAVVCDVVRGSSLGPAVYAGAAAERFAERLDDLSTA